MERSNETLCEMLTRILREAEVIGPDEKIESLMLSTESDKGFKAHKQFNF